MTDMNYVAVQAGPDASGFVELARSQKGRLFKKMILPMGDSFVHPSAPGKKIHIDRAFAETMRANFQAGICDIVQVPIVNDANQHVEDPLRNMGEVVDLTFDEKGIYAHIDARKHADDLGTTLLGASALMHMDYPDTKTGRKKGPTLLHVAVTNRPYLTNLEDFEEVIAASTGGIAGATDTSGETPVVLIPATEQEENMDLDQMLRALKDEHGIDVAALQNQNSQELVAAMSAVLAPNAEDTLTVKDVADAVIELAEERVALSSQVAALSSANEALAQREAESEVADLIKAGRILPKQRDKMVELARNDRETFEALLPDDAIVAMSATGLDTFDAPEVAQKFQQDIERLSAAANGTK
jgi:hypothetical protein